MKNDRIRSLRPVATLAEDLNPSQTGRGQDRLVWMRRPRTLDTSAGDRDAELATETPERVAA